MLRGLTRRPTPTMREPRTGYGPIDPGAEELLAIYHQLDPAWQPELLNNARMFALNAHANEPRLIGNVEQPPSKPQRD